MGKIFLYQNLKRNLEKKIKILIITHEVILQHSLELHEYKKYLIWYPCQF